MTAAQAFERWRRRSVFGLTATPCKKLPKIFDTGATGQLQSQKKSSVARRRLMARGSSR